MARTKKARTRPRKTIVAGPPIEFEAIRLQDNGTTYAEQIDKTGAHLTQRGGYTPAEDEEHTDIIMRARLQGASLQQIIRLMRQKADIGKARTRTLLQKALEQLGTSFEEQRRFARAEQSARLRNYIVQMNSESTGKRKMQDLLRTEELLARVEGTLAPMEIDVNATTTTAAMQVLLQMTPEQVGELLAEDMEQERLANLGRGLIPETAA